MPPEWGTSELCVSLVGIGGGPPAVRIRLQPERELTTGDERLGQPLEVTAEALSPAPLDGLRQAGVLRLCRQALVR